MNEEFTITFIFQYFLKQRHVAQASLELTVLSKMSVNYLSSCHHLLSLEISGTCHQNR